jgi:hypothetical protein
MGEILREGRFWLHSMGEPRARKRPKKFVHGCLGEITLGMMGAYYRDKIINNANYSSPHADPLPLRTVFGSSCGSGDHDTAYSLYTLLSSNRQQLQILTTAVAYS